MADETSRICVQYEIPEALRRNVKQALPEVGEIEDQGLREKVVNAWALALAETEFGSLDDIPCSPVPEAEEFAGRTQAHHLRATARLAVAIAEAIEEMMVRWEYREMSS